MGFTKEAWDRMKAAEESARNYKPDGETHTWYIERRRPRARKNPWERVDTLLCSQHDAEQKFFRVYFGRDRLIRADGLVTITVPQGEEKEDR